MYRVYVQEVGLTSISGAIAIHRQWMDGADDQREQGNEAVSRLILSKAKSLASTLQGLEAQLISDGTPLSKEEVDAIDDWNESEMDR